MTTDQAAIRQAVLDNSRAELLRELQASHQIIRNMLGLLTDSQIVELAARNARDQVDEEGVTRANEREAVIRRAGGQA